MPGDRDFLGESLFSPGVLRDLDKENIDNTAARLPARTPDGGSRRKLSAIKLYHHENTDGGLTATLSAKEKAPVKTPLSQNSATGSTALSCAMVEVDRYKEERRQAIAALKQRNERVQDLKAATALTNERYTALLKSHQETTKELAVLRTQFVGGGAATTAANIERLKAEAQSLETSNELLRKERSSLAARLAKREAACAGMKDELAAASQREGILREDLVRVRQELEEASREASEKAEALAAAEKGNDDRIDNAELALNKAAMEAQVKDLEEQLAAAVRRCGSVVAERAVIAEESMRQSRERDMIVAGLQEELHVMHRRTSADLGDWQRRHLEAVTARKAVEGQLEHLVSAGKSIALVGERQSALEASLQEACRLLSVALDAQLSGERVGVMQHREEAGGRIGVLAPERVVEGVIEHVLGRVFEASSRSESDEIGEEERQEREAEHQLRREALAALGDTLETLTAEMETLREAGVAEASIYLEQTKQLGVELDKARKHHQAAISKLEADRAASQKEVERLAQRVEEGDDERERLELQLETTMQLSEMALAASVKAGEEEQQQEASQRTTEEAGDAEAMEAQKNLLWEELEAEPQGYAEKIQALEGENRLLRGKLEDLAAQASALETKMATRDVNSPTKRLLSEEARAREASLDSMEARLKAVRAENEKLERAMVSVTGEADQASLARDERQAQIAVLEDEVKMLKGSVEAERARVARAKAADAAMRKYLLHYHTRNEQKMKEMQRRLANATARYAEQSP